MKKFLFGIKKGFNRVLVILTTVDILVWGTYSIATPIIGLYFADRFGANTIEYIGIGLAVFFFTRGLVQLPIGILTDRIKHDVDEILLLILGCIMIGTPFFLYRFVNEPWHYVGLQVFSGIGASLDLNSWRKLFAKNLLKGHEGVDYGLYEMAMSLGTAGLSLCGGLIANINREYFEYFLTAVGILQILGGCLVSLIYFIRNRKSYKI